MACIARTRLLFCGWILLFLLSYKECSAQSSIGLTLPEIVNTIVGDPVTLPATFQTNRQVVSVSWSKLNPRQPTKRIPVLKYLPMLQSTESYGVFKGRVVLEGRASLKIQRTTRRDGGTYVLTIMGEGFPTEEGFIEMNVLVPPKVEVGPTKPYVTAEGRSASLTCAVRDASPNVTSLRWEKDSTAIDTLRFDSKYSDGTLQSPDLLIHHVTRSDAGRYRCVAGHVVKSVSDSLLLEVRYPATIVSVSDSLTVAVSDNAVLQCVAEGHPPPNVTWSRNGIRLRSTTKRLSLGVCTSSLVLQKVRLNATGTYVCTASNKVGKDDIKSVMLSIRVARTGGEGVDVLILVGAIAGGMWLVICLALAVYFVRRRRQRQEKKRFSFYYNMGRGQGDKGGDRPGEETLEVTRHPNLKPPVKPRSPSAPYGGIETIRRTSNKGKVRRYARALYCYRPAEENELALEVDDVIEVLEGEDGGWCLGYLRGRIGLFPSNYVKFLSASQVSAAKLRELYEPVESKSSSSKASL
ncbi:HMCN1 [Branchiostoma lanceolatum]|uniref:HMCN1 protein n=1 Tax=Branchiostoma lanceolatum TaxID=7740 RepID=A0A8J9VIF6_BRALA|nr:HMCN1 [Branchiostoma lanceolatum]